VGRFDYEGMKCDTAREAISALLDDELAGVPVERVEEHLAGCRDCRVWKQAAHAVTRSVRLEAARLPSADVAGVVSVVKASSRVPGRPSRLTVARVALVAVAVAQIAVAAPGLIFGSDHSAPMHVAHEMGSFDMALAIGFLVAAWKPDRARGMRPLVGAAALLLVVTAISDLVGGRTSLGDEAPHVMAVIGWFLLVFVAVEAPPALAGPDRVSPNARRRQLGGRRWVFARPVSHRSRLSLSTARADSLARERSSRQRVA